MKPSAVIQNIIQTGNKLHFPADRYGYDMAFYPVFVFYYRNMLQTFCPTLDSLFYEYRLNSEMFKQTMIGDSKTNNRLSEAGFYIQHLSQNESMKKSLVDVFNETHFYTNDDLVSYLKENNVEIGRNNYDCDIDVINSLFERLFNAYIVYLVDRELSLLNIKTFQILDTQDAYYENRNHLRHIIMNVTPKAAISFASLLSLDIDNKDISKELENHRNDDTISADLFEKVHRTLSSKSRGMFETTLGLKFLIDKLNDFE